MILALGSFRLDLDRSFIGLNVTTAQKFPAQGSNHRHEQFTDSHDPTAERDSGKLRMVKRRRFFHSFFGARKPTSHKLLVSGAVLIWFF